MDSGQSTVDALPLSSHTGMHTPPNCDRISLRKKRRPNVQYVHNKLICESCTPISSLHLSIQLFLFLHSTMSRRSTRIGKRPFYCHKDRGSWASVSLSFDHSFFRHIHVLTSPHLQTLASTVIPVATSVASLKTKSTAASTSPVVKRRAVEKDSEVAPKAATPAKKVKKAKAEPLPEPEDDGLTRCIWANSTRYPLMQKYHDEEWCIPGGFDRTNRYLFEMLILEGKATEQHLASIRIGKKEK